MNELEAQAWLVDTLAVSRGTVAALSELTTMIITESARQNLVSRSTLDHLWSRHIADSAQLLAHVPIDARAWSDIGSGAGFPGLVIAILDSERQVTLIEPRRLRAEFLHSCVQMLGLNNVYVVDQKSERVTHRPAAVISARAVASLPALLAAAYHLADRDTIWLLPKGRSAASELEAARKSWQGCFVMQPSVTDPDASIIVATQVRRRSDR